MGNTLDQKYVSELIQAFKENDDERVRGMIAWALGRLGGADAKKALESFRSENKGIVREEIELALGACPVSV
jgi:epoxyqueuosine reductase